MKIEKFECDCLYDHCSNRMQVSIPRHEEYQVCLGFNREVDDFFMSRANALKLARFILDNIEGEEQ